MRCKKQQKEVEEEKEDRSDKKMNLSQAKVLS